MSAALVRKSLEFVDSDFTPGTGCKKLKRNKNNLNLIPQNHKILKTITQKGQKAKKVELLKTEKKITVAEARKSYKSQEQILEENLKKLQRIQEACVIDLDSRITHKLVERAITKRPVKLKRKSKKSEKTAFTEEDFAKFEEEYFAD